MDSTPSPVNIKNYKQSDEEHIAMLITQNPYYVHLDVRNHLASLITQEVPYVQSGLKQNFSIP